MVLLHHMWDHLEVWRQGTYWYVFWVCGRCGGYREERFVADQISELLFVALGRII